ncbi:hypothetical protein, partial [Desulfonatronospira sp.]|uniref:hypothetical protein n=1 Tax=Desulfonatronospira sp. TaxID=1962951 RepID=UPI0025BCBC88
SAWEHLPDAPRPLMIQHSLLNTIFSGISPLPKVSAGSRYASTQSVGAKKSFRVLPCVQWAKALGFL